MSNFKRRWKYYILCVILILSYNLYFIFLMRDAHVGYLLYIDLLLMIVLFVFAGVDWYLIRRFEKEKNSLAEAGEIVCLMFPDFENKDIAEHDVQLLSERLEKRFDENCELQDYVAKWCHEMKIPLAAGLLIDEKIEDVEIRREMREQMERMNQLLNSMLLGCKLQSSLFDLQIKKVPLAECVRNSIRNNQFFLIQKRFQPKIQVGEEAVYTDPAWLVYILDQLLGNALKYAGDNPVLRIWAEKSPDAVELFVEDNGEGIRDSDIRRIFEKGYTGSNYHNGKYKSTGMGLYMVSKIAARLGHGIAVESEYGAYTRFRITFGNHER